MYNVNNFKNIKNSNIQTPLKVSQFIYELLKNKIDQGLILDPCCGMGNLLKPWKNNHSILGLDIINNQDFLSYQDWKDDKPSLILCNPPFNGYGNRLGSEVWLDKIIELFGKEIPIVLFTPMGFRLNSKHNGKRWSKFINNIYPRISSIISLPIDIFKGVLFHSEILIFNIKGLQAHYFFNAKSKRQLINQANYLKNQTKIKLKRKSRYLNSKSDYKSEQGIK